LLTKVFADCRASMKLWGEDTADVSGGSRVVPVVPTDPTVDVGSDSDRFGGDVSIALMSFVKAWIPCWVPAARALATSPRLTGGITPNPVGTFGGSGDQPWVVLP
jgi:hypothetical protein